MNREKRMQSVRMSSTSFLKSREEKSCCLSIMQDMAVKTESNGLFSMKKHQKNAFGLQSQGSEPQENYVRAHVNCLWSMTAAEQQKQMNIKRFKKHICKIISNQPNLISRTTRKMWDQLKMRKTPLCKTKAMFKKSKPIEERVTWLLKLSITSASMDLLQVRQLLVNPLSLLR